MKAACLSERSTVSLTRVPNCNVESSASAARSIGQILAAREDAEQEAEPHGDGDCLKRILTDRVFGLARGLDRLVLGAAKLLVGNAADGRGQVLHLGADRLDLFGKLLGL